MIKIKKLFLSLLLSFCLFQNITFAASIDTNVVDNLIQDYIVFNNSNLNRGEIMALSQNILFYSYKYDVDPLVVTALIKAESNFNQDATSPVGAIGVGQLMPETARAVGVNPYNEQENIEGACSYLSTQIRNFANAEYPVEYALAAYNAGPNAVRNYGGIPPYLETQNYVQIIRDEYFMLYNTLMSSLG